MILIIGGAYQGKTDYANEHYGGKNIINNFHLLILEQVREGRDALKYVEHNLENYKEAVIICDDISGGIVPMDAVLRKWREDVGRCLVMLAGHSTCVIRVFCGIGTVLKG